MVRGISLANKCHLLFGAAVAMILAAALSAPWLLLRSVVDETASDVPRQIASLWPGVPSTEFSVTDASASAEAPPPEDNADSTPQPSAAADVHVTHIGASQLTLAAEQKGFASASVRRFLRDTRASSNAEAISQSTGRLYRFARAIRDEQGVLTDVIIVEHLSSRAAGQIFVARLYLLGAGLLAGALAILVFYLITTRLILSPVRKLRDTAERVRGGDHAIRADIRTGDEFEHLAEAFNAMLTELAQGHQRLQEVNQSLDLKVSELEESNIALSEAARIKADFIASVSHELRTPLNSIIGFAELLDEIATRENPQGDEPVTIDRAGYRKRRRYLENIVVAGKALLEMINELLEMARIEAGKIDLHVEPMSVASTCEGLLALIRPQAERKNLVLMLETPRGTSDLGVVADAPDARSEPKTPLIETDPRKFQQVIFNFLSNAVKFTPEGGAVTLRAERIVAGDLEPRIRVSVLDTGPGIPPADQRRIFEKFTQLESGHARQHAGTGLGLAICKELTAMIQGEIQLVSESGHGSMFSLIVPLRMDPARAVEMTLRTAGRGPASSAENSPHSAASPATQGSSESMGAPSRASDSETASS